MINFRTEILKALPIPDFFAWYKDNWGRSSLEIWADEIVELEKEGIVKIERGRVELVTQSHVSNQLCDCKDFTIKGKMLICKECGKEHKSLSA